MLGRLVREYRRFIRTRRFRPVSRGTTKYFCIGRNKTGTTSLHRAFEDLGYVVGNQRAAELLADRCYFEGDWAPIIAYCESAQVFQDVPFSWEGTFERVDRAYPNSKFILTIRDDAEQWYRSLTRFHAKRFGNGRLPTAADLQAATYVRKGFMYRAVKLHGTPDDDLYNKELMIGHYLAYNRDVRAYFDGRPDDLLVINLATEGAYCRFVDFLGVDSPFSDFPWENRTTVP